MSSPNIVQTDNVAVLSGGEFGACVSASADQPAGMHGVTAVQSAAIADISTSATGTQIATAVNALIAALEAKGIIASA